MSIPEATSIFATIVRFCLFALLVILPIQWIRHRTFSWPVLVTFLWIAICDMASYWMGYVGIFNFVIGFLYGPGALVAHYLAFGVSIQHKKRFTIATVLAFVGAFAIIANTVFFFGIERTGTWTSLVPYSVTAHVIISIGLLFELDILLNDSSSNREIKGLVWMNRAWMLYFAFGYLAWGIREFSLVMSDNMSVEYFRLFRQMSMALGYSALLLIGGYTVYKFNLNKEWRKLNS